MLNICLCAYWPSVFLLWINVYLGLLPFFNWVVNFFVIVVMSCLHTLEIKPLSVASFANDFLPLSRLSFHFVYGFLCCTFVSKVSLIRSHLFTFVFISIAMKDRTYPCQVIDLCPLHLLSLNVNMFHLNILYIFLNILYIYQN